MNIKRLNPILTITLWLLMSSCSKDLTDSHDGTLQSRSNPVRIAVDWKDFLCKDTPTGMTFVLFQHNDSVTNKDKQIINIASKTTNNTAFVDFNLKPAKYIAFVFNQSPSEFGSFSFNNIDDWNKAEVSATQCSSKWCVIHGEPIINNVEWLGAASKEISLTQDMIDSAEGSRIALDTMHASNTVYTLTVNVHIRNINALRSARAYIQGMAHGFMLGGHSPCKEKATQLLEKWSLSKDSTASDGNNTIKGTIKSQVATFGLPSGHSGKPEDNMLHLECLLRNDSILRLDYKIGDCFKQETDDTSNLNLTVDIIMKDPLPYIPDTSEDNEESSASGFDVTIDDWGEEHDVVVPI